MHFNVYEQHDLAINVFGFHILSICVDCARFKLWVQVFAFDNYKDYWPK